MQLDNPHKGQNQFMKNWLNKFKHNKNKEINI